MASPRVLASQLPSHEGRSVTLLGLAASAPADAPTATFTAADGKQVIVSLGQAAHASALVAGMPYDVVGVVQQGRINAVRTGGRAEAAVIASRNAVSPRFVGSADHSRPPLNPLTSPDLLVRLFATPAHHLPRRRASTLSLRRST